jgi:ApaG protein
MGKFSYIDGVRVEVDDVVYMPSLKTPPDKPYPFVYYITIYNESDRVIKILGRKWLVYESDGSCLVVEGEGVIGEKPTLNPRESFSYNSYHVVARSGEVAGAFYGVSDGEWFMVEIPEFKLNCPR